MGLFGKIFDKKYCSVCGNEIKLLGNRKLSDGNLCKECASKLSPWFSERRQSTVEEIKEQLDYRENNKEAVAAFELTRTLGQSTKVLLDENNLKFMVTGATNYKTANPDVLDFSAVTGCDIDVEENKTELKKEDPEGNKVSYNPAQYDYSYNIYCTIYVNNPYFNEIRFRVNRNSINIENTVVSKNASMAPHPAANQNGAHANASANTAKNVSNHTAGQRPQTNQHASAGQRTQSNQHVSTGQHPQPGHPVPGGMPPRMRAFVPDPQSNIDYQEAYSTATEIKETLTQVRQDSRDAFKKIKAARVPMTCPNCGATTTPDENGCCEYCSVKIVDLD